MMQQVNIRTSKRTELIDITESIEKIVQKSKISDGMCHIFIPHTTAGITINENADPSVKKDILDKLNSLVPEAGNYSHTEGNSDAHIKSSILGQEKTIIIEGGRLRLGTWQGIFFCEFDGPRNRQVWLTIRKE